MSFLAFWFDFASTYSYLSASRVEPLARAAGVELAWRPLLLGPIFQTQGWSDSPFNIYPAKGRYMWRDLERQSARYGLPFKRPSVFPRNSTLAARVALVGATEPWGAPFARAAFRANFAEDRDIARREEIVALLDEVLPPYGLLSVDVLARAESPAWKPRLRQQTLHAAELGMFGAPTFVVGSDLFWGDDRLEQALDAARAAVTPAAAAPGE